MDEREEPRPRGFPVLRLRPMFARVHHDYVLIGQPRTRQNPQPRLDILRQRRPAEIKPKLHSGRDFVDVLPARTGRADKTLFKGGIINEGRGTHGIGY